MGDHGIFALGTELSTFKFSSFWDWFINVSDPRIHWKNQPTYVIAQAVYIFGGIITLIHALVRGGRLGYLWLGIILHGFMIESITYIHPDVDNFWHSQTPIIFLGRRLPLHIILLYACFMYQGTIAAAKLKLPKWAEPFAVGLLSVLIDIPYDIVSVKFVHWTWHDTDPNIFDRHYWVPWNSYFFHATFAAGFVFWFHFLREKICNSEGKWIADKSITKELICTLLAALLGSPTGILAFMAIYHPLHDIYKIHSEVTCFIVFAIFFLISWSGDRKSAPNAKNGPSKIHWTSWMLVFHLVVHFATFLAMTIFFNPENEVSTGLKEPVGPCDQYVPLHTAAGITLSKRKYFCPTDYDEQYFDFGCLPNKKPPSDGSVWYSICGTKFSNRVEYIVIVALICFVAAGVFRNLHFKSHGDGVFDEKNGKTESSDKKMIKKKKN